MRHLRQLCGAIVRSILVVSVAFVHVQLISSCQPKKAFSVYEVNPLRQAILKNGVKAYSSFGYYNDKGQLEKEDSIVLDKKGNVIAQISLGPRISRRDCTYDTLNRLVKEIQRSDILTRVLYRYELLEDSGIVRKHTYFTDENDSLLELVESTTITYNNELSRILHERQTQWYDTTIFNITYEYAGDKIVKQLLDGDVFKEFHYDADGKLEMIETYNQTRRDYVSTTTGLIDSTVDKRFNQVTYYKYYQ